MRSPCTGSWSARQRAPWPEPESARTQSQDHHAGGRPRAGPRERGGSSPFSDYLELFGASRCNAVGSCFFAFGETLHRRLFGLARLQADSLQRAWHRRRAHTLRAACVPNGACVDA
ncbi:MAG: hypothetical protein VCF25_28065 [Candidatus Poribacteria bacterium]